MNEVKKEHDKARIKIEGPAGVISVDSSELINSKQAKRQLEALSKVKTEKGKCK